ncbi:uncharacterized protein LOC117298856 isoform X2 [Asterias rubens]|uniref:uncharacterized protein LOC117298856 isoform X2 n=1 Tax=Asterias rubens TaxID=7604 RepID=UPI0014555680|nr:uncharacterized protein LOC117298856 isoform X2 [Asterias rubens]
MDSSWKKRDCHFTWNLEEDKKVNKYKDKILRKVENNLKETPFLKIENLLFKACLQSRFKDQSVNALASLDEAKREIEHLRNKDVYKGYKSVEILNRMWIEENILSSNKILPELHEKLKSIQLEEKDLRVVGAIRAAALTRLGPVMFNTNLALFKAAHQAFPSNPDFLFGVALVTGQKMRFMKPIPSSHESLDPLLKNMMDEEKEYWEKLIELKPDHRGYHYAKSMLGLNLYRRDGSHDKEKASELLNEAYDDAPELQEVCRNLMRMLKKTDLDRCVSILETAIANQHDRTENHHQLAMCYIEKAKMNKERQDEAIEWTKRALEQLNECLKLDGSHVYALLKKAQQVRILKKLGLSDESPEDCYIDMMPLSKEFMPMKSIQLYNSYASYLYRKKTKSTPKFTALDMSQKVMDTCTDESFEHQNDITGKWEIRTQVTSYKGMAYNTLKKQYKSKKNNLKLGILFYQNFEFDQAIDMLATVDQTNAEVPYYVAKSYLKMGQEKTVGNQAKPAEAAEDFTRARENVELARESKLEQEKVREVLADIALAIAQNELQATANDVIQLEDRCVTSYRQAVRCGSLVAVLELMKLVEKGLIKITPSSSFIQMLAEIEVCCSQSQSDALHGESKPLTFEGGLRSKETDIEPCMLRNRTKIKADIKGILSKETFFWESREALFNMEVPLLAERFKAIKGEDGLLLDGREEGPLEDVSRNMKNKAVLCCRETRPLLDRIMELFQKEELEMEEEQGNYFPLILKDEKLTPETLKGELKKKLKLLTNIDMETHYPKIYECILKLQPKISPENTFIKNFCTIVNMTKHSSADVLDIEPNPVKLARQSIDKVEEICNVFFDTMKEAKALGMRVKDLVSAIRQGGGEEVEKADELFGILMKNEDFVIRMDNTCEFLEMLALINHCRLEAGTDIDLTMWVELSERNSRFSQDLRKGYLEVEAALLTNSDDQSSVPEECHKTCLEADKLINKSLQSEENQNPTFPFPDNCPGTNTPSWKGNVKKQLKKVLKSQKISDDRNLLGIILEAQPCSNEVNYHFLAMRKFLDDRSRGIIKDTVSIEKGTNTTESYGVLDLTRWCVNHAEKLASEVVDHFTQS